MNVRIHTKDRKRSIEESVAESLAVLSRESNFEEMVRRNDNNTNCNNGEISKDDDDDTTHNLWMNKFRSDYLGYDLARKKLNAVQLEIADLNKKLKKALKTLKFYSISVQMTGRAYKETYMMCKSELSSFNETLPIELLSNLASSSSVSPIFTTSNNNNKNTNFDDNCIDACEQVDNDNTLTTCSSNTNEETVPSEETLSLSSSSSSVHDNQKILKAKGIYTLACGFRVQLRKHSISKNTKSFLDALWLYETMICTFSKGG